MLEFRVTDLGKSFSPSGLVEGEPAGSGDTPRTPGKLTPGAGKGKTLGAWGWGDKLSLWVEWLRFLQTHSSPGSVPGPPRQEWVLGK